MAWSFDPFYGKVVLHMPFDGADGSTTFTDISANPAAVSRVGTATISTADSKFGGSSLRLPGGSYLTATESKFPNNQTEAGLAFWFKLDSLTGTQVLVDFRDGTATNSRGFYCEVTSAGQLNFRYQGTFASASTTAGYVAANTWYHLYLTYEHTGGTNQAHRIFFNGNYAFQGTFSGAFTDVPSNSIWIGADRTGANSMTGYIDDLRWDEGICRYRNQRPFDFEIDGPWPTVYGSPLRTPAPAVERVVGNSILGEGPRAAIPGLRKAKRADYGGAGIIAGTVKADSTPDDVPLQRKVRVFRDREGVCLEEVWSDPVTGNYVFTDLDPTQRYSVVAYDHLGVYRAVIADNLLPTVP